MPARVSVFLWIAVSIVYALVVFIGIRAPFIFDDDLGIVNNPAISLWDALSVVSLSPPDSTPYARPVVSLSLAANKLVFGITPWWYRTFNIILHSLNGFLLFLFLCELINPQNANSAVVKLVAFSFSVLWLFHPITTNVSLYVIQRAEGFVTSFYLLALLFAAKALRKTGVSSPPSIVIFYRTIAVASCYLAVLSKEHAFTIPLAVFVYDLFLVSQSWIEPIRKRLRWYVALFGSWGVLALVMSIWPRSNSVGSTQALGRVQYFFLQCEIIPDYLYKLVDPRVLHLDYWWYENTTTTAMLLGFTLLSTVAIVGIVLLTRRNLVGYLIVLSFLVLAPTSSFVPVNSMTGAEYRMYLPSAIILAAFGMVTNFVVLKFFDSDKAAKLTAVLFLISTVPYAFMTHLRASELTSPRVVWSQVLTRFPQNPRALNALANIAIDNREIEEAKRLLSYAIETSPNHSDAYATLGVLRAEEGDFDASIQMLKRSSEIWTFNPSVWMNLGISYAQVNRLEEAHDSLQTAIRLAPHLPEPRFNQAVLFAKEGKFQDAERSLSELLSIHPRHEQGRAALENIRRMLRQN